MSHEEWKDAEPSPRPGPTRVAVISRDGIVVNERMHRAADLFVYEHHAGGVTFVERRALPPASGRVFRDFSALASVVKDCAWIVSLGFNGEARKELTARGFRLLETRGPIEQVIRGLPLDTLPPPANPSSSA